MLNCSNTVGAASLLFLFQSATVPPAHSGERHVVLTIPLNRSSKFMFRTTAPTIGRRIIWA